MDIEKIYGIIEKELKNGKELEEIYIEHDNKLAEEFEKPPGDQNSEKKKEYIEVREQVAHCIALDVLKQKGYIRLNRWEKPKEEQ